MQLNSTVKEKRKTGSLYAVVDLAESPVDEAHWFKVRSVWKADASLFTSMTSRPLTTQRQTQHRA